MDLIHSVDNQRAEVCKKINEMRNGDRGVATVTEEHVFDNEMWLETEREYCEEEYERLTQVVDIEGKVKYD